MKRPADEIHRARARAIVDAAEGAAGRIRTLSRAHHVRVFDYTRFAEPLRERVRARAAALAAEAYIGFTMADNAFVRIVDRQRAQDLADGVSPDQLHRALDRYARLCCPVLDVFEQT